jgi:hypothetical protein
MSEGQPRGGPGSSSIEAEGWQQCHRYRFTFSLKTPSKNLITPNS